MKKIIGALALATGLFACASNSVKYNQSQFRSENYQREMTNSIEYADSFVDFDQRHIPQASLDATDFAVLLSADVSYNQNAYAQAAGKYYYLANKYHDPRLIYKAIVCFEHSSVTAGDYAYAKLNSLIAQLLIAAPDSNTAHLFGISVELDKNDLVAAKRLAHRLKGSAANVGATALSRQAALIEKSISSDLHSEIQLTEAAEELSLLFGQTRTELSSILHS